MVTDCPRGCIFLAAAAAVVQAVTLAAPTGLNQPATFALLSPSAVSTYFLFYYYQLIAFLCLLTFVFFCRHSVLA